MLPYQRLITVDVFGYPIGTEPVIFVLGFALFFYLLLKDMNLSQDDNGYFVLTVFFISFIGGRLFSYILPWRGFKFFLKFFYELDPNLSSMGMFVGGTFALYLMARKHRQNFVRLLDKVVLIMPLVIAVLRVGCFVNGHIRGEVADVAWCVEKFGACRHPVALYLIVGSLLIFAILKIIKPHIRYDGELATYFIFLYYVNRAVINNFNMEKFGFIWFALVVLVHLVIVNIFLIKNKLRDKKEIEKILKKNLFLETYMIRRLFSRKSR